MAAVIGRAAAWLPAMALLACASAEIRPGETPDVPESEGLIVMGLDVVSLVRVQGVSEDGDAFALADFYRGENLRVLHVPPGRYCLRRAAFQLAAYELDPGLCFEVKAGARTVLGLVERASRFTGTMDRGEVLEAFQMRYHDLAERFSETLRPEVELPPTSAYREVD